MTMSLNFLAAILSVRRSINFDSLKKTPLETPQIQRFPIGLANYPRLFSFARVRAFKTAIKKQAIFHACDFIV